MRRTSWEIVCSLCVLRLVWWCITVVSLFHVSWSSLLSVVLQKEKFGDDTGVGYPESLRKSETA